MLQLQSSCSAMHFCKNVPCPKDAFIPGSPAHFPQAEGQREPCRSAPSDRRTTLHHWGGVYRDKDRCWSQLFGGNQILVRHLRFTFGVSDNGACYTYNLDAPDTTYVILLDYCTTLYKQVFTSFKRNYPLKIARSYPAALYLVICALWYQNVLPTFGIGGKCSPSTHSLFQSSQRCGQALASLTEFDALLLFLSVCHHLFHLMERGFRSFSWPFLLI